jgi:hypothetical protein
MNRFTVVCAGLGHGVRDGWNDPAALTQTEPPMFKTLVLALVLAGASLSFIGNLSAAPVRGDGWQPAQNYMSDRHNPTDTNGF